MLKSDIWIEEMATKHEMLVPFQKELVRKDEEGGRFVSFGTSSYGYDVRLAPEFKIFTNSNQMGAAGIIDPKNFNEKNFVYHKGDHVIVPPNSFVLGRTLEYIKMPDDVISLVMNKSTYARCGLDCMTTVIEPGWEGELVLEFANNTPLPIILYANEGCAQLLFLQGDSKCRTNYRDRGGKYQGQKGVTTPKT